MWKSGPGSQEYSGIRHPRLKYGPQNQRQSLEQIIDASKRVEQQIELIATAATQQASASGEISESAGQISQLATESSQGAEEAPEALNGLASMASDLSNLIQQFRLDSGQQMGGSLRAVSHQALELRHQAVRS